MRTILRALFPLLLLTACNPDPDGDGVGDGDCDNADPTIYPGAVEIFCDDIDQDCSGADDVDGDRDGASGCDGTDCNDADGAIYPGATELCDGFDQDCDGIPDDGLGDNTYWPDGDGDGFGDEDAAFTSCDGDAPDSAVEPGAPDCDDGDATIHPDAEDVCDAVDNDCDGVVDQAFDGDEDNVTSCGPDGVAGNADDDCDDADDAAFPGAPELCDGLDQDCDLAPGADEFDGDGDQFVPCDPWIGEIGLLGGDCDDADVAVNPLATEVCNGIDDDCEGGVDEGFDLDADTVATCGPDGVPGSADDDCDDGNAFVYPGAAEVCDGLDTDCDTVQESDDQDADSDGYAGCATWVDQGGGVVGGGDCDDQDAESFPGAPELCDGADNDCDLGVDEDFDVDLDGWFDGDIAACAATYGSGVDCDDTSPTVNPAAVEYCDGLDNNCDGELDALDLDDFTGGDADADGDFAVACGGGDCDDLDPAVNDLDGDRDGESNCDGDCDDTNPYLHTGRAESCDGLDNDCNGAVDDAVQSDVDGDGYGTTGCGIAGDDCDDNDPHVFPDLADTSGLLRDCLPAIYPGFYGTWHYARVNTPGAFIDPVSGNHYLYARGYHDRSAQWIGVSESPDGLSWGPLEGPVLTGATGAGAFDAWGLSSPSVAYVPGKARPYVMLYHGQPTSGSDRRIGLATALSPTGDPDGTWKRLDLAGAAVTAPVINYSTNPMAPDSFRVLDPSIRLDAATGVLHAYYTGRRNVTNGYSIVHASCDTDTSDCGTAADWVKTDLDADLLPDVMVGVGASGEFDDERVSQALALPDSISGLPEFEFFYTGNEESFGAAWGTAFEWEKCAYNPILTASADPDRFDGSTVTGRVVQYEVGGASNGAGLYHFFYGTNLDLPDGPDANTYADDPVWGTDNYSLTASYIAHATNVEPIVAITAAGAVGTTVTLSGLIEDTAPDTVVVEIRDASDNVLATTLPATVPSSPLPQQAAWTTSFTLPSGTYSLTAVATDLGCARREDTVLVLVP
jgi:hypothetical protein